MKHILLTALLLVSVTSYSQLPCENGLIDDLYPCNQTILMGHLTPEELLAPEHDGFFLNDIWGWTDPVTSDEYAIIGLTDGVAFVRVTDPQNPLMLGKLNETPPAGENRVFHGQSFWRDVKVYKNHAFIVSDLNYEHGMQVFDLTKLRDLTSNQGDSFEPDFLYTGIASSHNLAINEETGYAYVVGSKFYTNETNRCDGLHIVNIQDPKNPIFVTCYNADGYTHDAQAVIYEGPDSDYTGKEICFGSNEDTFTIFDVEDKDDISIIARKEYTNSRYAHQGWLTEDHKYFLMNDELDEEAFGHNPRTYVWDVSDLDNPKIIGSFFNEAKAIDHNLYVKGNLVFESNYQSGLRIHDLGRVAYGALREVAYFDSYPQADQIVYGGSWSNYPYFESGNILISDINNGLFIIRLDITDGITKHPVDTVYINTESHFSIEVSDDQATFQWQRFGGYKFSDIQENSKYSGVTTSTLTTTLSTAEANHIFRCVVTDSEGRIFYSFPSMSALTENGEEVPLGLDTYGRFRIFPNPASEAIVIPISTDAGYEIFTLSGQEVEKGQIKAEDPVLNVQSYPNGIYLLRISVARQIFESKFVVQRN